jgi:hypothetical protein
MEDIKMRRVILLLVVVLSLGFVLPAVAVMVSEDDNYVIIENDIYELHWKKAEQMGYMQAFIGGSSESIIGSNGRAFYHSSDYGGWSDWGALVSWEIVSDTGSSVTIRYVSRDAKTKEYSSDVTYYDGVPYIKHDLTITNTGAAADSFSSGHEPMFEVNVDVLGMEVYTDPFPHVAYWTASGAFGALYGPDAENAEKMAWGGRDDGRMHLIHNNLAKPIADGQSDSVTYYVAFGEGGQEEAHALAAQVQMPPSAVSPGDSLISTWGQLKR